MLSAYSIADAGAVAHGTNDGGRACENPDWERGHLARAPSGVLRTCAMMHTPRHMHDGGAVLCSTAAGVPKARLTHDSGTGGTRAAVVRYSHSLGVGGDAR